MRMYWTTEQISYLREIAPGKHTREILSLFKAKFGIDLSYTRFKNAKARYNIKTGYKGSMFQKGQIPHNKGKKMSPELYAKCKATMFKKGHKNHNLLPVGSISEIEGYKVIKVNDKFDRNKNWISLAAYNWIKENGEIPKGYVVIHLNGDITNDDVSNLGLVSRRELVNINRDHLIKSDKHLTQANINITRLKLKLMDLKNES